MESIPFKFEPLENNEEVKRDFLGYENGLVRTNPGSWILGGGYLEDGHAERIYNFQLRPDDVWIVTYPKSGTTWMQYLVSLLLNNLDVEKSKKLDELSPFLDIDQTTPKLKFLRELNEMRIDPNVATELKPEIEGIIHSFKKTKVEVANSLPMNSPRLIKSHLPFELLPPNLLKENKVIYVARDPRDVMVSFYHHHRLIRHHEFIGDFKDFFQYFIKDQVMWCPFWNHIEQAWKLRDHENLLFVFYDDMKKNIRLVIETLMEFLGKSYTEEDTQKLIKYTSIGEMRNNVSVNDTQKLIDLGIFKENEGSFIRTGKSGGWKTYFDKNMRREIEAWTDENTRNKDLPLDKLWKN